MPVTCHIYLCFDSFKFVFETKVCFPTLRLANKGDLVEIINIRNSCFKRNEKLRNMLEEGQNSFPHVIN
jgi:hypothetical protein